ncbi:MAG TPA: hypothetical protein VLA09_10845 [Longimicrobiales bacterium]|nr:hypothetical protein [Longimicrobiales bacterium]
MPTPVLFAPGVISTAYTREYGITFDPTGTEAYFTRGGGGRGAPPPQIHVARFVDGAWTEGGVAPFSRAGDESPFLAEGGRRLLFSSRRDLPEWGPLRSDNNLWIVDRFEGGWSSPEPLPGEVNRPRLDGRAAPARGESGPVLLEDGSLLYWTYEDPDRGPDLYVAYERDGLFVEPRPLRVNSSGSESNPAISPDGLHLVFQAFRDLDAIGGEDLYVAERTQYGWGPARLLPEPLNSPGDDGYPSFSPDGRYLFFASDRGASGSVSIYYVEAAAAGLNGSAP